MSPTLLCIPELDACGDGHLGHYCAHVGPHATHRCLEHDATWPRDPEYELARRLYVAHWTVRHADQPEQPQFPPPRVVVAACWPDDSHWRRLAQLALTFSEGLHA